MILYRLCKLYLLILLLISNSVDTKEGELVIKYIYNKNQSMLDFYLDRIFIKTSCKNDVNNQYFYQWCLINKPVHRNNKIEFNFKISERNKFLLKELSLTNTRGKEKLLKEAISDVAFDLGTKLGIRFVRLYFGSTSKDDTYFNTEYQLAKTFEIFLHYSNKNRQIIVKRDVNSKISIR